MNNNFLKKIEKYIINIVIIILICIISTQIVMKDQTAYQKLKNIEMSVKNIFRDQAVVEVMNNSTYEKENIIVIDLLQDYSLPQVWLVKNGRKVDDFSEGIVQTEVKYGDLLIIDAKLCDKPLWFEITRLSPEISNLHEGQQFRLFSEEKRIGIVEYYDKL
ncbi:MAG: hypothetical protein ACOC1N_03050 [Bacillota bacterium]